MTAAILRLCDYERPVRRVEPCEGGAEVVILPLIRVERLAEASRQQRRSLGETWRPPFTGEIS